MRFSAFPRLDPGYPNVGYPTLVQFCTLYSDPKHGKAALALEKLNRIQLLWTDLGRTSLGTPECKALMAKIRALSSEYHALVDQPKKPEE
jgi:hypothetical protein